MTGTGAQGFGLRLRTERTRLYAVSCRKVKLHGLCRLGGILTSRRTHPLTHMASKAAAISPTRSTKSAYEEYVNPQWVSLLKLLGLNEEYERCQGTALYTKDVCPRDYWPAGHGLRAELLSWANRRGLVADE